MSSLEFHRQVINLLCEGQIVLAAVHAHENQNIQLEEERLRRHVHAQTLSEFHQLLGELNGGSTL